MTGLDPDAEKIIEIATIVTDVSLEVLAEGPEDCGHQAAEVLAAMDEWNTEQHGRSGLTEPRAREHCTMEEAEKRTGRVPETVRATPNVSDVRKQRLPRSTLSPPLHAATREASSTIATST